MQCGMAVRLGDQQRFEWILAPGEQCGADVGGERSDPVDAREVERRHQHPVAAASLGEEVDQQPGHAVRRIPVLGSGGT